MCRSDVWARGAVLLRRYRDWLEECAKELMSPALPLLVPTPNTQENVGEHRDAWTVAPRALTKDTTRMLVFLGQVATPQAPRKKHSHPTRVRT